MSNFYGNGSDFWTSDEEDYVKDINKQNDLCYFNDSSTYYLNNVLDTLNWIPLLPKPTNRSSVFDILDKEYDTDVDFDIIEDQLYKGILNSSDEEEDDDIADNDPSIIHTTCQSYIDDPSVSPVYDSSINIEEQIITDTISANTGEFRNEMSARHDDFNITSDVIGNIDDFYVNKKLYEPKLNFTIPPGLDEHINRRKDELIIPPPDQTKNYIRKKWSILDNTSPVLPIENMLIEYPFELDDFQKRAIHQLINNKHVFVSAHTSAGKTVIAEYGIALALSRGEKAIYTSPIKALSNQKYREFKKRFGTENVGIVTGDVSCNPEANCLIVTTEILRNLLYRGDSIIGQLGVVIFDEIHYINDKSRGVVWEEVIIMLPTNIQLVMLSSTVPNYIEFADWIGRVMQKEVIIVVTNHRPTPLVHYLYIFNKMFLLIGPKGFNKDAYHNMYRYSKIIKANINKNQHLKAKFKNFKSYLGY